ncbi:MAG: hypothetical protein JNL13_01245 [Chitinophagaceae bacterium]|nr:hypothetical protein [Chitinophagaceae bacterium]
MKKLIILFLAVLGFTTSFAQSSPAAKKQVTQTVTETKKTVKQEGDKMKKDGTPDMRYKENKEAVKKETVHLKKDGTPDKRYKENKK